MDDGWMAPGPGSWIRDDAHFTGAMSGYVAALFLPAFAEGWRIGFARYGLPIEALVPAMVRGRMFARVQPVGAPEPKDGKSSSPPPKPVMRVLFALHPELRRRRKAAAETLATKRWRIDRARWRATDAPALHARCLKLQAVEASALDDASLCAHLAELEALFHDGQVIHFAQNPASAIPVGDFIACAAQWTGVDPVDLAVVLQGRSPMSAQPLQLLDPVADAARRVPGLAATLSDATLAPAVRFEALRASSPEVAVALDAYLAEYGHRIVTGFDVTDRTLDELPAVIVASVLSRIEGSSGQDLESAGDAAADRLRERVPESHRVEFDQLLEEARAGYALHDEDVGYTYMWPLGLIRRGLLAAGERLVARGVVQQAEHVFEAESRELASLLSGDPSAPTGAQLSHRADERRQLSQLDAPDHLGPEGALPDPSIFPGPVARITRAFLTSIADANFAREEAEQVASGASGIAASPGVYEGRARVLTRPDEMDRIEVGDVLIAPITSPAYNTVLPLLGAIVTDKGGALCHAAIVAREFGIPAVVGTVTATRSIPDGAKVSVDGTNGIVTLLG